MGSFWVALAGSVAVTFGSRLAGLMLRRELPPFGLAFLHFVPIAVFAALVTPSLLGERGEGEVRSVAALVTAVAAWRSKNLAVALAAGLATFWLARGLL